jgi:hypothetical protein
MVSLSYDIYKRHMPMKLAVFYSSSGVKLNPLGLGLQVGPMIIPVSDGKKMEHWWN